MKNSLNREYQFYNAEERQCLSSGSRFGRDAVKDLPKILTHSEFVKHVKAAPFPPLVLKSPVTEVMLAYFPSDLSSDCKDAAAARFKHFAKTGLGNCSDVKGVSYGWGLENNFPVRGGDEGQTGSILLAFIGWPSVEAHLKFKETEAFKKNVGWITGMEGLIKVIMLHISCRSLDRQIA